MKIFSEYIVRVRVFEKHPLRERKEPPLVLTSEFETQEPEHLTVKEVSSDVIHVARSSDGKSIVSLSLSPLKLSFTYDGSDIIEVNSRGLFAFEHYREKPVSDEEEEDPSEEPGAQNGEGATEHEKEEEQDEFQEVKEEAVEEPDETDLPADQGWLILGAEL